MNKYLIPFFAIAAFIISPAHSALKPADAKRFTQIGYELGLQVDPRAHGQIFLDAKRAGRDRDRAFYLHRGIPPIGGGVYAAAAAGPAPAPAGPAPAGPTIGGGVYAAVAAGPAPAPAGPAPAGPTITIKGLKVNFDDEFILKRAAEILLKDYGMPHEDDLYIQATVNALKAKRDIVTKPEIEAAYDALLSPYSKALDRLRKNYPGMPLRAIQTEMPRIMRLLDLTRYRRNAAGFNKDLDVLATIGFAKDLMAQQERDMRRYSSIKGLQRNKLFAKREAIIVALLNSNPELGDIGENLIRELNQKTEDIKTAQLKLYVGAFRQHGPASRYAAQAAGIPSLNFARILNDRIRRTGFETASLQNIEKGISALTLNEIQQLITAVEANQITKIEAGAFAYILRLNAIIRDNRPSGVVTIGALKTLYRRLLDRLDSAAPTAPIPAGNHGTISAILDKIQEGEEAATRRRKSGKKVARRERALRARYGDDYMNRAARGAKFDRTGDGKPDRRAPRPPRGAPPPPPPPPPGGFGGAGGPPPAAGAADATGIPAWLVGQKPRGKTLADVYAFYRRLTDAQRTRLEQEAEGAGMIRPRLMLFNRWLIRGRAD